VQDNISLILPLVFHLASIHLGRDTQRQIHWSVEGPRGSKTPTILLTMKDNNAKEEVEGILSKVITEEIAKTCNERGPQKKQRFMAVMKVVCKTPPTEMGKNIATIEKITKVNKIVETIQGTKDSGGAYGGTMVDIERIIVQATSDKKDEDATTVKSSKQKDIISKALGSKAKKTGESFGEEKTFDMRGLVVKS
jgi:hypothetical protein